jgi:hypothetical protein
MSIINNRMKVTTIKHVYFIKDNVRGVLEKKEQTCEDVVRVADDIQLGTLNPGQSTIVISKSVNVNAPLLSS